MATALAVAVAAAVPPAAAQEVPSARIAIIDYQRLLQESSAAQDIREQLDERRQVYQDEITQQEQELRAADQELARQRAILSPEAFAQKRREFEARVAEVQRQVQARKRELDQAYDTGLKEVQRELVGIIADLSDARDFNLVLSRQQIVFADNALNISDEVLALLNQRLPTVEVPLSQN